MPVIQARRNDCENALQKLRNDGGTVTQIVLIVLMQYLVISHPLHYGNRNRTRDHALLVITIVCSRKLNIHNLTCLQRFEEIDQHGMGDQPMGRVDDDRFSFSRHIAFELQARSPTSWPVPLQTR
jgi:hypothetical protein